MTNCETVRFGRVEEFAIYLNYVRKLGFTETPDYNFLRDLFTKALRTTGETEDGVYDWMLLNGGKGWQQTSVSFRSPSHVPRGIPNLSPPVPLTLKLSLPFPFAFLHQPVLPPRRGSSSHRLLGFH